MKKIYLILLFFILFESCIQINPQYAYLEEKYPQYKLTEFSVNKDIFTSDTFYNVYRMDKDVLEQIINTSNKDYFLIYSCRYYCTTEDCLYIDTILQDYYNNNNVQLIVITEGNNTYKPIVSEFYKQKKYPYPTFMLDIYKYGHNRKEDNEQRMFSFLMDVCPSTKLEEMMNVFILLDKNKNILLEGKYDNKNKQNIKQLTLCEK